MLRLLRVSIDQLTLVEDYFETNALWPNSRSHLPIIGTDCHMDMRGPTTKEIDRVLFLKFDAAGKVARKTVFCDKLSAVFGLVWHNEALYVNC